MRHPPHPEQRPLSTISQLYPTIELYSDGEPPRHTLFVLSRGIAPPLGEGDQLLLIDPPDDAATRFTLPQRTVAVYTESRQSATLATLATLETVPGGVAHIRIGDHLLDLYTQQAGAIAMLPALGLLCGGVFGSDHLLPRLAPGSDGSEELETLRLLARLVRERRVQLFIPRQGTLVTERSSMMERLADDVGYIHGLRRVVPVLGGDGQGVNAALAMADTLLPAGRASALCRAVNAANVQAIYLATTHTHN